MENTDVRLTPFQVNNLLRFLDRVQINGIDEANAFMEIINLIREANKEASDKK